MNFGINSQSRIEGLDLLRALAVLLVLGHHAALRFRPLPEDPLGAIFLRSGWIGVDIFFVISGFMITRILLKSPDDIGAFFRKRVFRIVPIFVVAVFVFTMLSLATGTNLDILQRIWSPALLLNGWTIPIYGYAEVPFTITWSLSVEEFAYIALGTAAMLGRSGLRRCIGAFLIVAPLVRVIAVSTGLIDTFDLYFFVLARLDSIAVGGLAALGLFDRLASIKGMALASLFVMLALIWTVQFVPIKNPLMPLFGYLLFGVVTAMVVASVAQPGVWCKKVSENGFLLAQVTRARVLSVEFGQLSYFIYLFHMFILEALRVVMPWLGFWSALALTSAITFIAARLSWRRLEAPLIERGRRNSWREAFGVALPGGTLPK
jgi:peptidoglycan/LPS O-acetylase OafA/YrhL